MLKKFYKQYLRRFYLARLLRLLVGKMVWAVRWRIIHPIKSLLVNFVRKVKYFHFSLCRRFLKSDLIFSRRQRLLFFKVFVFISVLISPVLDFVVGKILKPLARRFIPRNIRTKLLSYDIRKRLFFWRSRELPLLPMNDAVIAGKIMACAEMFAEENVICCAPAVFPSALDGVVALPADSYIFPAISVVEVEDAKIEGLSNFVECNAEVLHHDLYQFSHDYTSEELHGRLTIYPGRKSIKKFAESEVGVFLEAAAVFTDACSPNYAHWLTEVLPRIHVGAKSGLDDNIPFIVDAGLHSNLVSSAGLLAGTHPLVELRRGERVQVKKLYVVGATGYIPFDRRPTMDEAGYSHGVFSASALKSMRAQLFSLLGTSDGDYPRKIMLRRSSGARAMRNEEALALRLQELGFSSIYPEKLTFSQQYHLFSNAECIVGATGAAMANLVFCQPSCRVVICISSHAEHSFGYWRNMASAIGNNIRYVLGPVLGEKNQGVHADFFVSVDDVIVAINY